MPNDTIQPFLDRLPVSTEAKSQLWDSYYSAKTPDEFQHSLDSLKLHEDPAQDKQIKSRIWDYKYAPAGVDPTVHATPIDLKTASTPLTTPSLPSRAQLPPDLTASVLPKSQEPDLTKPGFVPGLFGQPTPSAPLQNQIDVQNSLSRRASEKAAKEQENFNSLPAPIRFAEKTVAPIFNSISPEEKRLAAGSPLNEATLRLRRVRPALEEAVPPSAKGALPDVARGALAGVGSVGTLDNIAMLAAMPEGTFGTLIGTYFTGTMANSLMEQKKQLSDAWAKGDKEQAAQVLGQMLVTAGVTGLAGAHTAVDLAGHGAIGLDELAKKTGAPSLEKFKGNPLYDLLSKVPGKTSDEQVEHARMLGVLPTEPVVNGETVPDITARETAAREHQLQYGSSPASRLAALRAPRSVANEMPATQAMENENVANENAASGLQKMDQRAAPELNTPEAVQQLRRNGPSPLVQGSVALRGEQQRQSELPQPGDAPISPEAVADVFANKKYTILTAEDPQNRPLSPAENAARLAQLEKSLKNLGLSPVPINGNEDGKETHAFLVPEMNTKDAIELGKKFDQQSIITNQGLVDLNSERVNPHRGVIYGKDALRSPYHSSIDMGDNNQLPFSFKFGDKDVPAKSDFEGRHFSEATGLSTLSGARRGLSKTGAEGERIALGGEPGSYFYMNGTQPEPQVISRKGEYLAKGEKAVADLSIDEKTSKFHDPKWQEVYDKAYSEAQAQGHNGNASHFAINAVEKAVREDGYDGYHSNNKVAFLFGDTPVSKLGDEPAAPKKVEAPPVLPRPLPATVLERTPEPVAFRGKVPLPEEAPKEKVKAKTDLNFNAGKGEEEPPFSSTKPTPKPKTPLVPAPSLARKHTLKTLAEILANSTKDSADQKRLSDSQKMAIEDEAFRRAYSPTKEERAQDEARRRQDNEQWFGGKKEEKKGEKKDDSESPFSMHSGFNPVAAVKHLSGLFSKNVPQVTVNVDPKMDNILKTQSEGKVTRDSHSADSFYLRTKERFYDDLARVSAAVEQAKKRGLKLSPDKDPEVISALARGGGAGGAELAGMDLASIAGRAHKDGLLEATTRYLNYKGYERAYGILAEKEATARAAGNLAEAKEYADKIAKAEVVPEKYTPAELKQAIADFEKALPPDQLKKVQAFAKEVWDTNRHLWDKLHDYGILSDEVHAQGIRRGPEYIPLERIIPDSITALEKAYGRSDEKFSSPVGLSLSEQHALKSLEGSVYTNDNPFRASLNWHSIGWKDIWRNRAAQTFIDFAKADTGGLKNYTFELHGGQGVPDSRLYGVVAAFEGGKVHRYAVPRLIADAMKNLSKKQAEMAGMGALKFTRDVFRLGATGANLAFSVPNALKDVQDMLNLSKASPNNFKDGTRLLQTYGETLGKRFAAEWTAFDKLRKDPIFRDFLEGGASYSTLQKNITPEHFAHHAIPDFSKESLPTKALKIIRAPLTSVEKLNNVIEETTKLATYNTLRQKGMSPEEAAFETRRYGGSPDFARMGTNSPLYNLMFMFFNAQVQGVMRTFTGFARNPKRLGVLLTGMGMAQAALMANNLRYTNPEDGDLEWNHIIDSDKQNYFVVITPFTEQTPEGNTRHVYIRIPKGHSTVVMNPVQDGMELAMSKVLGKQTSLSPVKSLVATAGNVMPGSFNLEEGKIPMSVARGVIASLNPMMKEPLEELGNWDTFRNISIVPRSLEDVAPNEQSRPTTSPVAIKAAEVFSKMPGFKDYSWFTSPIRLEHELRGFLPGFSEYILGLQASPAAKLRQSTESVREIPAIGPTVNRFLGSYTDQKLRDSEEAFYDVYSQANQAQRTYLSLKSEPEKQAKFLQDPKNMVYVTSAPMFQNAVQSLSKIRIWQRAVVADEHLSDDTKRDYLSKLVKMQTKILNQSQQMQQLVGKRMDDLKRTPKKAEPQNNVPQIAPTPKPDITVPDLQG